MFGRHRGACARSGRLRTRAVGPQRTLARVRREAGATVRWQAKLRDMNVMVAANDQRAIEVLASGLPLFQGAQLAVDITIRSALTTTAAAAPNTSRTDGATLLQARRDKERKYVELLAGDRCRLVVVGVETGGRWSAEATEFVSNLAAAKAREAPPVLRGSVSEGWRRRWTQMQSVSCSKAFACTLMSPSSDAPVGVEGGAPDLVDLIHGVTGQAEVSSVALLGLDV